MAQGHVDSVCNGRDQVEDRLAAGVMAAIEVADRYGVTSTAVADGPLEGPVAVAREHTDPAHHQVELAVAVEVAHADRPSVALSELKGLVRKVLAIGQYSEGAIAVLQVYVKLPCFEANGHIQLAIAREVARHHGNCIVYTDGVGRVQN